MLGRRDLLMELPAPPPFPVLEEAVESSLASTEFNNKKGEKLNEDIREKIIENFVENHVKASLLAVESSSLSPDFKFSTIDSPSASTAPTFVVQAISSRLKETEFHNMMKNNSSDCIRKIISATDEEKVMLQKGFVKDIPLSINSATYINIETLNCTKIAENQTTYGDNNEFFIEEVAYTNPPAEMLIKTLLDELVEAVCNVHLGDIHLFST